MMTRPCVFANVELKSVRTVKLIQQIKNNLNLKGSTFLYIPCILAKPSLVLSRKNNKRKIHIRMKSIVKLLAYLFV